MAASEPAAAVAVAASCRGVGRVYRGGVVAVADVDADFAAGRLTAVVGPSGSGKSTLLRVLAGLDRPSSGSVRVGGVELGGLGARGRRRLRRRLIGYVFPAPAANLVPYLTAAEHLDLAAHLRGVPAEPEWLGRVGIEHRAGSLPAELSGGEQQRLAVAAALVGGTTLVVADEPTAELDQATGSALASLLLGLREGGSTFVVCSHDPVVMDAADVRIHLDHGAVSGRD